MKSFDLKIIAEVDVTDYLNLKENPLYLKLDPKDKEGCYGLIIKSRPEKGFLKMNCIHDFELEFRKNPFFYDSHCKKRIDYLQGFLHK